VTPTHYDISHNFFVQLQGRKKVLLFPPQSWQHLYLHPLLHPGGLSTQTDVGSPPAPQQERFPHFQPEHLLGFEADIGTVHVFRQKFTLADAIGSHACPLEENMLVTNGILLGSPLLLLIGTVNCVQTLKVLAMCCIFHHCGFTG
jgi:hypothetical protein